MQYEWRSEHRQRGRLRNYCVFFDSHFATPERKNVKKPACAAKLRELCCRTTKRKEGHKEYQSLLYFDLSFIFESDLCS